MVILPKCARETVTLAGDKSCFSFPRGHQKQEVALGVGSLYLMRDRKHEGIKETLVQGTRLAVRLTYFQVPKAKEATL